MVPVTDIGEWLYQISIMGLLFMKYPFKHVMMQVYRPTSQLRYRQGLRQGKSLEGESDPGAQGAEPLGGGEGAKPPEADPF